MTYVNLTNCITNDIKFTKSFNSIVDPINYVIIFSNFFISLVILLITRFCNIPGRIFRIFVYNAYGLNFLLDIILFVYIFYHKAIENDIYDKYGNDIISDRQIFNLITSKNFELVLFLS